jgi:hypothetical protein
MLDLSQLFYTTKQQPCFLNELDLTSGEKGTISQAKNDVREALRTGIPRAMRENGYEGKVVVPRFYIQGSWAYKTLNRPCHTPPQQSDVDDGVYLPMSIVKEEERPSIASSFFFDAAEAALKDLVKSNGWALVTDKATCIRIEISELAHIDIPLYAIPDQEFLLITEAFEARRYVGNASAMDSVNDRWESLPSDKVLLAHREKNWMKSDPRAMKDWFMGEVLKKGEQLRRIVRYLKAFRDSQWASGGPSSILLMAAAAPLFDANPRRDDLALLQVLKKMPDALRSGVVNPTDTESFLTDALTPDAREEAAQSFEKFSAYLDAAIHSKCAVQACSWLSEMLGDRFPSRPDLVNVVSIAAAVALVPAEAGPSEPVKRTKAG